LFQQGLVPHLATDAQCPVPLFVSGRKNNPLQKIFLSSAFDCFTKTNLTRDLG